MKATERKDRSLVCKFPSSHDRSLFLGTILTAIASKKAFGRPLSKGEKQIVLVREPTNFLDPLAIRVEDEHETPIGYLTQSVAKWLSPLLKEELVFVEGKLLSDGGYSRSLKPQSVSVRISLSSASPTEDILKIKTVESRQDVLHQLVYQAYELAQGYREPTLIQHLVDVIHPLTRQELHPQTGLLLALLPGMISDAKE